MSYSENMINMILDQVEEHLPQIRKATEKDFHFIVNDPKGGFKNFNVNDFNINDSAPDIISTLLEKKFSLDKDCCNKCDDCSCDKESTSEEDMMPGFPVVDETNFQEDSNDNSQEFSQCFEGISTEVKHKNKTITVSDATLSVKKNLKNVFGDEDENKDTEFIAYLGENSKVFISINNPDYDEDLSHIGNAKKIVADYLKDNPTVVTVLNKVDDKDVRSYSAEVDTAEEAVDIIYTVGKNTSVTAVVSFPADKTFEVVSQVANLEAAIAFDIYPTGDRNILMTFTSLI